MSRSLTTMYEKDKLRGLVPSARVGYKDRVYGRYLETLNPRENEDVQKALASSPDVRFTEFLERINLNRYKKVSLQTIAKACNISLMEFANFWQKASTQQAIATAQLGTVAISEDMVYDAKSKPSVCERCEGLRFVAAPEGLEGADIPGYRQISFGLDAKWIRNCPSCQGTGFIRKGGDSHARDRVLEMSGILQRGRASVQIVQNFGSGAHASALADLDDTMRLDDEVVDTTCQDVTDEDDPI